MVEAVTGSEAQADLLRETEVATEVAVDTTTATVGMGVVRQDQDPRRGPTGALEAEVAGEIALLI